MECEPKDDNTPPSTIIDIEVSDINLNHNSDSIYDIDIKNTNKDIVSTNKPANSNTIDNLKQNIAKDTINDAWDQLVSPMSNHLYNSNDNTITNCITPHTSDLNTFQQPYDLRDIFPPPLSVHDTRNTVCTTDTKMSKRTMLEFHRMFCIFDSDKDGYISRREFIHGIRQYEDIREFLCHCPGKGLRVAQEYNENSKLILSLFTDILCSPSSNSSDTTYVYEHVKDNTNTPPNTIDWKHFCNYFKIEYISPIDKRLLPAHKPPNFSFIFGSTLAGMAAPSEPLLQQYPKHSCKDSNYRNIFIQDNTKEYDTKQYKKQKTDKSIRLAYQLFTELDAFQGISNAYTLYALNVLLQRQEIQQDIPSYNKTIKVNVTNNNNNNNTNEDIYTLRFILRSIDCIDVLYPFLPSNIVESILKNNQCPRCGDIIQSTRPHVCKNISLQHTIQDMLVICHKSENTSLMIPPLWDWSDAIQYFEEQARLGRFAVQLIINLTPNHSLSSVITLRRSKLRIVYAHIPIADYQAPTLAQCYMFCRLADCFYGHTVDITAFFPDGPAKKVQTSVVLHCVIGKGRTGTLLACYLAYRSILSGYIPDSSECIFTIRQIRSGSIETKAQESIVNTFIQFCRLYLYQPPLVEFSAT